MLFSMQETIVIIPCYNESQRIDKIAFINFLTKNPDVTLFFVDDGSTDDTFSIITQFTNHLTNAICFQMETNQGKAEAIRLSILHLISNYKYRFIGYFDADLSTSLDYIILFRNELVKNNDLKIIMGARIRRLGATISRNPARHIFGRIVATIASIILTLPVYDTQCGAKLFEASFVKKVFELPFITKWLFDIEILKRLNALYSSDIITNRTLEYPLENWIDDGNTRIKLKDFIRVPIDLMKIAINKPK